MAPILLNPTQALQNKALMLQNHKETLEAIGVETKARKNALGLEEGFVPMKNAKNMYEAEDPQSKMRKYVKRNKKHFNAS